MAIDFDAGRWERVKQTYRRWWAGELDRPVIHCELRGRDPGRAEPEQPSHWFTSLYDLSIPAELVVDCWDYELSKRKFLGDAYPHVWPNFGPGVMAALLGSELVNGQDTVWFAPKQQLPLDEIHFEYDGDNVWLGRIKDLCRAAMERWQGLVQVGMTDLGGALDILSTFRPADQLLLDLYDHPEQVKRLVWELHELWYRYWGEIDQVLQPTNPGYSSWAKIFCDKSYYMLQCDFCFMISPGMFDEFVRPELAATCDRLDRPFYHLDGPGQIAHIDSLLSIENLRGVQWIHGAGQPSGLHWVDLYCKILDAGKRAQIFAKSEGFELIDVLTKRTGKQGNLYLASQGTLDDEVALTALLQKHGAA